MNTISWIYGEVFYFENISQYGDFWVGLVINLKCEKMTTKTSVWNVKVSEKLIVALPRAYSGGSVECHTVATDDVGRKVAASSFSKTLCQAALHTNEFLEPFLGPD